MDNYNFLKSIERRDFLKIVSFTGVAGLIYPKELISKILLDPLTRIVIVEDTNATIKTGLKVNAGVVQTMLDEGVKTLTKLPDVGTAWKSLFPNIAISSKIALKVNTLFPTCTHPEVTYAVANGLKKMDFGGQLFPANNIIIFDNSTNNLRNAASGTTNLKYTINTSATEVRCFGTDSSGVGYNSQTYSIVGSNQRLSKIITDISDFIINIAVLKNHSPGVTLCMKNHYGSVNSPGGLHANFDQQIPALNALPPIATKQKVFIIDALFGVISGGPGGNAQVNPNKIIMGTDIVAVDTTGRKLLADIGCKTTNMATHVDIAATQYALGTNDFSKMETITIQNPSSVDNGRNDERGCTLSQNYPNPFVDKTSIDFYIDKPVQTELTIFDTNGGQICTLLNRTLEPGQHTIKWGGTTASGSAVPNGNYICRLKAGGYSKSIIVQVVR